MTTFNSVPFKSVMFERKIIKFTKEGIYNTDDKGEIEVLLKAKNVTKEKTSK